MNAPNGVDPTVVAVGNHSPKNLTKYPHLAYKFAQSEKFGELSPFFKYHGEYGDKNVILHSNSSVDSMSLHAPILQHIKHNKDFYAVDMHGILPHCWDLIHNQPSHGSDIDATRANCLIRLDSLSDKDVTLKTLLTNLIDNGAYLYTKLDGSIVPGFEDEYLFEEFLSWIRCFVLLNELFAPDSLFNEMHIPLADILDANNGESIYKLLDECWKFYNDFLAKLSDVYSNTLIEVLFLDIDGNTVHRHLFDFANVSDRIQFYYDFLDNPYCIFRNDDIIINDLYTVYDSVLLIGNYPLLELFFNDQNSSITSYFNNGDNTKYEFLNISPLVAYQLSCFEFFTNDLVDYIYSAEMFRKLYEGFAFDRGLTFDYNGYSIPYDGFSAITIESIMVYASNQSLYAYDLFLNLITRKRSLRYIDYFTGCRPTPLLAADTEVAVNNDVASAIDITQKTLLARFNLMVQRVGRKSREYIGKIFHSSEREDVCCPVKIGHIAEYIYMEETQNTAADQLTLDNSRTATLKASDSRFAFDTDCDVATIIIGISSYEIERFYNNGLDPFALKVDRYDMFNPMLQNLGDVPVFQSEINAGFGSRQSDWFGYRNKDLEYKTGINYACGAFKRGALQDWIFVQNPNDLWGYINPDFIRSHQYELDKYYVALTGTTSYDRYHFICKYNNKVIAYRNMVFAPLINF